MANSDVPPVNTAPSISPTRELSDGGSPCISRKQVQPQHAAALPKEDPLSRRERTLSQSIAAKTSGAIGPPGSKLCRSIPGMHKQQRKQRKPAPLIRLEHRAASSTRSLPFSQLHLTCGTSFGSTPAAGSVSRPTGPDSRPSGWSSMPPMPSQISRWFHS